MSAVKRTVGVVGDQFYLTHCATADSVLNNPGYTVRAASVTDDESLEAAFRYPPYELPIDMWKALPAKAQTPRRLARTVHPRGGVWVAHSVYLEKDSVGRDRSYFSHLLHLPVEAAHPLAVLESWDASGWTQADLAGASKSLPRGSLPAGRAISKGMLLAFLSRSKTGATDLSSVVCPTRLHSDVNARRDLVTQFLQALVLVTAEKNAGGSRDRLFVHAEPGLVAMMLYAAARVLPPHFTTDLTFSTFEPAHRNIRAYKLGTVVGTFLGVPGKGLDVALATQCGYVLDALELDRSSPELSGWVGFTDGIAELIDLAAEGRWETLGKVHRRIGTGAEALARAERTINKLRASPEVVSAVSKPAVGPQTPVARQVAESGSAPPVLETPAPCSATTQPTRPPALPARAAARAGFWGDARVKVAVIMGGVLLAVVALALQNPNRSSGTAKREPSATVPVTPTGMPLANPPQRKGTGEKPLATNPVPAETKPAILPDPIPPKRKRPLPVAENPTMLTETVGLLGGLQLYQTYLNIGLLADARTEGLYEAAELTQLLGSVVMPLEKVERNLEKIANLKSLTEDEVAAVARMRKIAGLLREEGKSLQSFWDTGRADHGKKYEETRQAVWKELSDLLVLDPKQDVSLEPKPAEEP